MKRLFLIIATLALQIGCADEQPAAPSAAPPAGQPNIDQSVLMPLKVGNSWTYRVTYDDGLNRFTEEETTTIVADTMYRGIRWYRTNKGEYYSTQGKETLFRFNLDDIATIRVGTLPVAVGDTFGDLGIVEDSLMVGMVLRTHVFTIATNLRASVTVPAGTFEGIRAEFRVVSADSSMIVEAGNGDHEIHVPGIGLVFAATYKAGTGGTPLFWKRELIRYELK